MMKIILASSHREAVAYAKDQGWRSGEYRYPVKASTIRGLRVAEIHELASFAKRFDRHAILGVLRYARVPAWYAIDDGWTWPRPRVGEQLELDYQGLLDLLDGSEETAVSVITGLDPAELADLGGLEDKEPKAPEPKPAAKPKRTRPKPVPASVGFFDE